MYYLFFGLDSITLVVEGLRAFLSPFFLVKATGTRACPFDPSSLSDQLHERTLRPLPDFSCSQQRVPILFAHTNVRTSVHPKRPLA